MCIPTHTKNNINKAFENNLTRQIQLIVPLNRFKGVFLNKC